MPKNCEADDDAGQVLFDLELQGATWRAAVSYDALARMFSPPRQDATTGEVRESRQQVVRHSKAIARFVIGPSSLRSRSARTRQDCVRRVAIG